MAGGYNCSGMSLFKQPYFIIFFGVFLVVYTLQKLQIPLPLWINNYVNDFLCMPVVLSICLAVIRTLKKDNKLFLPLSAILSLTIFYAIYFEYYLPKVNVRYTADWLDVLLYFFGAGVFYLFQKRNVIKPGGLY